MAPEILRYEKYDAKADLWSVGAVLFEMSVGKPPFRAQNHVDLLRKIERGEDKIKFPDEKKHDETTDKVPTRVAPDLKALIRALLKRNPGERMSFDDFFRDASRVATGGTAVGLMSAESVSAEYARIASLSNVITTSRTPSSSTPTPPLNPPPPPIPSYIDQEPPPFARRPSQATPPLPAPSPASGSGSSRTSSFAPKYVVAGSGSNAADADIKVRDFVVPRASTSYVHRPLEREAVLTDPGDGRNDVPVNRVGSAMDRLADQTREADSMTESSDSVLGRDYVVVEKRTVEINALADGPSHSIPLPASTDGFSAELANAPKQSNLVVQRTGRGFLSRPLSSLGTTPPTTLAPVAPYPPVLSPYDSNTTPPFAIPAQRQVSAPHPYSLASSPRPPSFLSSSPRSATFIERFPGSPHALVGSPTAAIAKGLLNMASLKIFGSPTDGILLRRASTRKPISRSTPVVDPEEDKLMSELEEIAQKALVIFDFADSKIIHILPPTPQTSSSTSLGTPSYFSHLAAREQASMNPFSPIPTSSSPMRRTSSSSSERPFGIPPSTVKAEVIAAESMVLYLKSLAFLGKGIEKARKFWNGRKTDQAPSPDFNEGESRRP
jgi:serine/threonine-protein kinase ULK/ATG1